MIKPRTKTPEITVDLVNGTKWTLSEQHPEHFTMVIFYRGKHCPVCKTYLETLQEKITQFTEQGINIIALSADTREKAEQTYKDWKIPDVPLGFGFKIEDARLWGLFISKGVKEEPEQFIEPGLFLIKADGTLYSASIQSMPFARPEFDAMLKAIRYIIRKDYPARGES